MKNQPCVPKPTFHSGWKLTLLDFAVPLFTNVQLARRFVEALTRKSLSDLQIKSWREYER